MTSDWDDIEERVHASFFKGRGVSVSRLAVLSLEQHFTMFQAQLVRPPNRMLEGVAEINIGHLQKVAREYEHRPTELTVEEAPTEDNPAHAEIPQSINRGLSDAIVAHLEIHR